MLKIMKTKNIGSWLCMAGLLFSVACSKKLDQTPVSSITNSNFYTNTNDFLQAVNGVYNKLRLYPDHLLWMGEMRSDNIAATSDGNRDWQGINDFSPNLTTTGFIVETWDNDYNGIYNANTVLDQLAAKGANVTDSTLRKRLTAECRFLRAFYYFDLVRYFGKVPLITKVMTTDEVLTIPRSPVADVYNQIIDDLQFAIANLPATYAAADIGRPTSNAAKGILGLVYLTRSGPTYDIEGPGMNSNEYDKALALFNDVINSGQYTFINNYPSIFSYTNENNKEVIFDIQFMTTSNGADYPSMLVPPAYFTGLGLSGYGNGYGTCAFNITPNLMNSYKTSAGGGVDIRDTFSIQHKFNVTATQVDTTRPFIKKYINISARGTGLRDWPINFIVLRYTDVLMMKAECILHGAAGTQADVDAIVNQVRKRAGLAPVSNVTLPMLMEERRREFLGEGLRWNDLVREGMAVTTMNAWIASDAITTINKVIPQYILYPVPQAEILVKPGLYTQNDGYY
jgi:hypothetical protein